MASLTPVFRKNSRAYRGGHNLIINQGGQGSGKTYSILDLFYLLPKYRFPKERKIFTISSNSMPHLKLGAIRDFEKVLLSFGENPDSLHNKTDHFFRIGNSIIDYFGIRDNYSKTIGPRRDFLYLNEINNKITFDDFDNMNQRTEECTFVDYNPRSEFWLHDEVLPYFKHAFIKSTYLDNPYIPKNELKKILWKKDKPKFANWWKVYGLGELGQFEGTIFTDWEYGDFDDTLSSGFGLDFGFHPSPDALVKVAIDKKHKIIHASECIYETELLPSELTDEIGEHATRNDQIIADSADPRMIKNLQTKFNIQGVKKTGTIAEWIRLMQDYKFIITEDSPNLTKELNNYVWSDKKAGIPIDAWNHLIDGIRYQFMSQNQMRIPTKAY
ncbi:hypothetical protein ES705_42631 [subsurface metagenome]